MIIARFLVVVLATAVSMVAVATSINRPGGFVSVENMVINADAIALVEVTGGDLFVDLVPPALYRIKIIKGVVGDMTAGDCLAGPRGLRVGSRYLVFIESSAWQERKKQPAGCVVAGTIGDVVPRAMEIIALASGEEFARLDNEKIVYPRFSGTFPVHQQVTEDNLESTLIIGSWAPLRGVLEYVAEIRNRSKEE